MGGVRRKGRTEAKLVLKSRMTRNTMEVKRKSGRGRKAPRAGKAMTPGNRPDIGKDSAWPFEWELMDSVASDGWSTESEPNRE